MQYPIFISYRQNDSIQEARTLRSELELKFGTNSVFQDERDIKTGAAWPDELRTHLCEAKIVLVLIKSVVNWMEKTDDFGGFKVHTETCWVRNEVEYSLKNGKTIFTVFAHDEFFTEAAIKTLPECMKKICSKQAHQLRSEKGQGWQNDMDALIQKIHQEIGLPFVTEKTTATIDCPKLENFPLPDYNPDVHSRIPFKGLSWFKEADAHCFFGREYDIEEVKNKVEKTHDRLLFLYGKSGVGKSSFLHAGLLPRFKQKGWKIAYKRRIKETKAAIDAASEGITVKGLTQFCADNYDSQNEDQLFILDQVEEILTNPGEDYKAEMAELKQFLMEQKQQSSKLNIILSFRKEYLAEFKKLVEPQYFDTKLLESMNRQSLAWAAGGIFQKTKLCDDFFKGLHLAEDSKNLPEEMANSLDNQSEEENAAPLLQFILTKMWDAEYERVEQKGGKITFSEELFKKFKMTKTIAELLKQQLDTLTSSHKDAVTSGWALNVLNEMVSADFTSANISEDKLIDKYDPKVIELLKALENAYLIHTYTLDAAGTEEKQWRLSHDALAPIVRLKHDESILPAQLAIKIKEAKEREYKAAGDRTAGIQFSSSDIKMIEKAEHYIPKMKPQLDALLKENKVKYDRDKKQRVKDALEKADQHIDFLQYSEAWNQLSTYVSEGLRSDDFDEKIEELPCGLWLTDQFEALEQLIQHLKTVHHFDIPEHFRQAASIKDHKNDFKTWYCDKFDKTIWDSQYALHFPNMVEIEGGRFMMGDDSLTEYSDDAVPWLLRERPVKQVSVPSFALGETPVTFIQYLLFCKETEDKDIKAPKDSGFGGGMKPVINVNYENAEAYCAWLSEKTGKTFRLPIESQWEFAARERGKKGVVFGNGKAVARPSEMNFNCAVSGGVPRLEELDKTAYRGLTTNVKKFDPNALGLYDMSGNVYEWCQDHFGETLDGVPSDGTARITDNSGASRVVRGGAWPYSMMICRVSYRGNNNPSNTSDSVGFRVSQDLE